MSPTSSLAQLTDSLSSVFGERLMTGASRLAPLVESEGHHVHCLPAAMIQPASVEEVQLAVRAAAAANCPIVPFGARTSLEGNCAPIPNGLAMDLSRMNRVLAVETDDLLCVVEPGVTREQLNRELRATGLFFAVDPGADATIGGMISTRASGTNAVRYGTMRENVLALRVVLPSGELISTGTRARKSSAGYDLTHLFTGAEGTLGIVVEAILRLHGAPSTVLSGHWPFATVDGAVATVTSAIQLGLPVARLELLDETAVRACNAYSGTDLPEQPTLFVELHGSPLTVAEHRATLLQLGASNGGSEAALSTDLDEQRRLWRARHAALPAARALVPSAVVWSTDICVPISRLSEAIARARADIAEARLIAPILGHVGDGNFHVFFVLRREDRDAWAAAARINERMIDFALSVGGTSTGEHGIGLGKREALRREHGKGAVGVMRTIKHALDPRGLMNPGKIFE